MTTSLTGRACNLFSLERLKKSHGTRVIYAIHNRAGITFPSEELRQPAPLAANAGNDVPLLIQNSVRILISQHASSVSSITLVGSAIGVIFWVQGRRSAQERTPFQPQTRME